MLDLALVLLLARWAMGWLLGARSPSLARLGGVRSVLPSEMRSALRFSVIIPARNEAESLPNLLGTVAPQTLPPFEVIVVDDASTDNTALIARDAGATALSFGNPPPGWLGKPWACWQGAQHSNGDVLVFLDADTVMTPAFLELLAARLDEAPGIVSVAPFHETRRVYEQASGLFHLVSFMGIGLSNVRLRTRVTGAFGPCIAIRRGDYERIRGHSAVQSDVLEDIAIARNAVRAGIEVRNYVAGDHFRYRMYPNGMRQLVEGWSKNIAAGARSTPWLRTVAIAAWVSGLIESAWVFASGLIGMAFGGPVLAQSAVLMYALFTAQLLVLLRRVGSFNVAAVCYPIAALAFLAIFSNSIVMLMRGKVKWKDRVIDLSRPGTHQP